MTVASSGSFSVSLKDQVLISAAGVVVAAPAWSHSTGQYSLKPYVDREKNTSAERFVLRGEFGNEQGLGTWNFLEALTPLEDGVRVRYEVSPRQDTAISEACLFLDLPYAAWQGRSILLYPSGRQEFLPHGEGSKHFLSGPVTMAVLGTGGTGPLSFTFSEPALATVQHIGSAEKPGYQIYPRLRTGGTVKAGETCSLEFTLRPADLTPSELADLERTLHSEGKPGVRLVAVNGQSIPIFRKFEITAEVTGSWDNPYDPDEVALDAEITLPSGKTVTVPGFYCQDAERKKIGGGEIILLTGTSSWKIRYAPPEPGVYRYVLVVRNRGTTARSGESSFACEADPGSHGFLRVSRENPHYLQLDDGTPFFAVGENIAALGDTGLALGEELYAKFADVGGNLVRSWWCSGVTDIESRQSNWPGEGLGHYKQRNAWCIDRLVEHAEVLGIRLMCCLETQQYLRREKTWPTFTYNAANGGPAQSPADYFVNPEAARFFRNRLRYIVARWSYSTAIFSWQFWNEVGACNNFHLENAARWHREMARYLRSIDPVGHVIHTNHGNFDGYPAIDGMPEIELISTNIYSRRDMGQTSAWGTTLMQERYDKPFLITEYGVGHHGGWDREDPNGVIAHNGLWGALVSGAAGTSMPWGWLDWVDAFDFYRYWRPVTRMVEGIPFCRRSWGPVQVDSLSFPDSNPHPLYYSGIFFEGWPRNYAFSLFPEPPPVITLDADGKLADQGGLRGRLGAGECHRIELVCPVDGEFIVHVPEISPKQGPVLEIVVDGRTRLSQALVSATDRPWEFWQVFPVDLTVGKHLVEIRNAGTGGLWTGYELTRYRKRTGPDLEVMGMQCEDALLLWLRNPQFIWAYMREGRELQVQPEGVLTLTSVPNGEYSVLWIETTTNDTLLETRAAAQSGRLVLRVPEISRSAAAKIIRR